MARTMRTAVELSDDEAKALDSLAQAAGVPPHVAAAALLRYGLLTHRQGVSMVEGMRRAAATSDERTH